MSVLVKRRRGKGDDMVRRAGRLSGLKMQRGDRLKRIGIIGVDSGQVIVTDPAYIGKASGIPSYDKITEANLAGETQLKNRKGINLAVVSSSGLGDGVYPVYAVTGKADRFGERVKALVVDFEVEKKIPFMKKLLKRG
jgi:hypothetical protein